MRRWASVWLLLAGAAAWAQVPETREFPLKYARATEVCRLFGGAVPTLDAETRGSLTDPASVAERAFKALPDGAWQWHMNTQTSTTSAFRSPEAGTNPPGALRTLLPEGLAGPPVLQLARNALIVSGTNDALAKFGEILGLLDRPTALVNLEVRILDVDMRPRLGAVSDWNHLPDGTLAEPGFARLTLDQYLTPEVLRAHPTASLVLPANTSSECAFTELFPHYLAEDQTATPRVLYSALRIRLVPRVNADRSVTVFVASEGSMGLVGQGQPAAPLAVSSLQTQVRVADDDILLGQPWAAAPEALEKWLATQPQLGQRRLRSPLLAITPKVLEMPGKPSTAPGQ